MRQIESHSNQDFNQARWRDRFQAVHRHHIALALLSVSFTGFSCAMEIRTFERLKNLSDPPRLPGIRGMNGHEDVVMAVGFLTPSRFLLSQPQTCKRLCRATGCGAGVGTSAMAHAGVTFCRATGCDAGTGPAQSVH